MPEKFVILNCNLKPQPFLFRCCRGELFSKVNHLFAVHLVCSFTPQISGTTAKCKAHLAGMHLGNASLYFHFGRTQGGEQTWKS